MFSTMSPELDRSIARNSLVGRFLFRVGGLFNRGVDSRPPETQSMTSTQMPKLHDASSCERFVNDGSLVTQVACCCGHESPFERVSVDDSEMNLAPTKITKPAE